MMPNTTISAIYGARRTAGLDDDTARDLYERETGKRSLKLMTAGEQRQVLDALRRAAPAAERPLSGPYARKLQALWIDGWNLGVVEDRRDSAMLAFVARQSGIERTEFLRAAKDARKAVEGLKQWLTRAAGVEWGALAVPIDDVIAAQFRLLGIDRAVEPDDARLSEAYLAWRDDVLTEADRLNLTRQLGQRIRRRTGQ